MTVPLARRVAAAAIVFSALALSGPPALAQFDSREYIALQNQILEIRRQVQALQDQFGRGGGTAPIPLARGGAPVPPSTGSDLTAQLLQRVDLLEEQVRQLRGRIDQTENTVQRQGAELGKRLDDLAFAQGTPGTGSAGRPQPGSPPAPSPPGSLMLVPPPSAPGGPPPLASAPGQPGAPPTATMRRTPEVAMQEGNAALARRDYPTAEAAAREVLTNRTSPRAYDAQFLLAQALSGARQYSQAAIAYDDTYNRSKKGMHAPDALLGLANALLGINEKKAACDTLAKLKVEYPAPRPDVRDAALAAGQRAGCR